MSMNDKGAFSPAHIIIAILVVAVIILAGTIIMSVENHEETYPENKDRDEAIGYLDFAIRVESRPDSASTSPIYHYSVWINDAKIHSGRPDIGLQWFIPGLTSSDGTPVLSANIVVTYPDGETATDSMNLDYESGVWTKVFSFSPVLYFEDGHYTIKVELGTTDNLYSTATASYLVENGVLTKL